MWPTFIQVTRVNSRSDSAIDDSTINIALGLLLLLFYYYYYFLAHKHKAVGTEF